MTNYADIPITPKQDNSMTGADITQACDLTMCHL